MNFLSRTFPALLAILVLSALGAHAACGIRIVGSPEPDLYVGYFPRGFCRMQFFTNAPPQATASIWRRPGIALSNVAVTASVVLAPNRRVEADFGEHGSYRGRMRKDGCSIVGRLRARNFPNAKNVNRVLRLYPYSPSYGYGFGAVIGLTMPISSYTNSLPDHPIIPPYPYRTNDLGPILPPTRTP